MCKSRRVLLIPVSVLLLLLGLISAPTASAGPYCDLWWGSLPKSSSGDPVVTPITDVRAGRHACFDRMVVDVAGPLQAFEVRYVRSVRNIAGESVRLRGGAKLRISVWAPTYDVFTGTPVYQPAKPARIVSVDGFRTFRQVRFVDSFEGISTFGLGVRGRLPMRAFVLNGPGDGSRLVVDVAHRW